MSSSLNQSKIDFLINAINDTQELIRFIDTKLGIAITLIGGLLAVLLTMIDKIVSFSPNYPWLFWLLGSAFVLLLIACIGITIKIIVPTSDPNKNINFGNIPLPQLKFYLSKNKYHSRFFCFYNSDKHSLNESFETYLNVLDSADEKGIIETLACEKFKLNYIRNIKSDRLRLLTYFLITTTFIFVCFFVTFSIQTHVTMQKKSVSRVQIHHSFVKPPQTAIKKSTDTSKLYKTKAQGGSNNK